MLRGHAELSPVSPRGGGGSCHPPQPPGNLGKRRNLRKSGGKSWERRFLAHFWARGSARGAGPLPALGASLSHPRSPPVSPRPALSHQPVWPPPSGAFQSLPSPDCPFWGHPRRGGDTPRWHRQRRPRPEPPPEGPPPPPGDTQRLRMAPGCDNPGGVTPRVPPALCCPLRDPSQVWGGAGNEQGKDKKTPEIL